MILVALLALPITGALISLGARPFHTYAARASAVLAGLAFALSLGVAGLCLARGEVSSGPGQFLRADGLSAILALVVSGVAWVSIWAGLGSAGHGWGEGAPQETTLRRYYVLTNIFVFTMLLAVVANNVGVMWVALEATTITTAFLVGLKRTRAALEASWKYIMVGSVGIALAFVGTVFAYFDFVQHVGETDYALNWTVLSRVAPGLSGDVLRVAFVFILIGYGTKAGLAPMHTWLPDAHSEAPAPISSMMSGSLLAVALYAVLRWKVVVDAAVGPEFTARMLILMGTVTVALAALLLLRQGSYKRLLAYSSIEHTGLACLGLGLGPLGVLASMLHIMSHAAGKSLAFLLAGRILARYGTTRIDSVRGLLKALPWTGSLFLVACLALLGLPPFGLFISEMLLLRAGFLSGHPWVTGLVIGLLVLIFVAILGDLNRMVYADPPAGVTCGETDGRGLLPVVFNLAALIALGVAVPAPLLALVRQAVGIVQP